MGPSLALTHKLKLFLGATPADSQLVCLPPVGIFQYVILCSFALPLFYYLVSLALKSYFVFVTRLGLIRSIRLSGEEGRKI